MELIASEYLNKLMGALEMKDFITMEIVYQEIKEKFGEFVFDEERNGRIRFRKKLRRDTFFADIYHNCVELPKEGIAYLNITKTICTTLHMFDNSCMIIAPSARLSHIYQLGAFSSKPISLDVATNILELDEQSMIEADLHNGDVLKIDIEPTGMFLHKFELDDLWIYSL